MSTLVIAGNQGPFSCPELSAMTEYRIDTCGFRFLSTSYLHILYTIYTNSVKPHHAFLWPSRAPCRGLSSAGGSFHVFSFF